MELKNITLIDPMTVKVILPYSTYFFSLDIFNKSEKIVCHVEEPINGDKVKYEFKSQKHAWMCLRDKIREAKNKEIEISWK